jgi:phage shock protein A
MGLMRRFTSIFRAKASKALDRVEDPRETLDYSYERQLELLQKMRRGVADVATSRKRIELQAQDLQRRASKLEQQARQAVTANREDLARDALTRRQGIANELSTLQVQHDQLKTEEAKLVDASRRLEAKVQSFRTRKETIKASYTAAEAQTKVGEALSGIGEEMGDVGMAMERAENKVAQMQARSGALDELMASGALDDMTVGAGDRIQSELDSAMAEPAVEAELARMRGELTGGAGTDMPQLGKAAEAPAEQPAAPQQQQQEQEPEQPAPSQQPLPPLPEVGNESVEEKK